MFEKKKTLKRSEKSKEKSKALTRKNKSVPIHINIAHKLEREHYREALNCKNTVQ